MKTFTALAAEQKKFLFKIAFFLQLAVLFVYATSARIFFYFERPNSLVFVMIAVAICVELGIQFLRKEKLYFPTSAIITALSCSLLIDATNPDPYIFAVALGILSKFLLRSETGHYFNPANFGVVLVLVLYLGNINLSAMIFAGSIYISLAFFLLGLVIAFLAGQIFTSIFWIINFSLIAFIRADFSLDIFFPSLRVLTSAAMLLFLFNMITDPKTAPNSLKGKYFYTFTIAAIDGIFRLAFIPYGNFYALFFISALMPILHAKKNQ